jgi:hypothetical protein
MVGRGRGKRPSEGPSNARSKRPRAAASVSVNAMLREQGRPVAQSAFVHHPVERNAYGVVREQRRVVYTPANKPSVPPALVSHGKEPSSSNAPLNSDIPFSAPNDTFFAFDDASNEERAGKKNRFTKNGQPVPSKSVSASGLQELTVTLADAVVLSRT